MSVPVAIKLLRDGARLPSRAYEHDAAFDLCAVEALTLAPGQRAVVPTGVALGLPPHVAALTLPRSGLAARHGITVVNAPGLIDPGYRGEVKIILLNTDPNEAFCIAIGDRIAQLLIIALAPVELVLTETLEPSTRGERGFGSSGAGPRPGAHSSE